MLKKQHFHISLCKHTKTEKWNNSRLAMPLCKLWTSNNVSWIY